MSEKRTLFPLDSQLEDWPSSGRVTLFDLEVTSWPGAFEHGWREVNQHREVIEIGAIILDVSDNYREVDAFTRVVKPTLNPVLSDYIIDLIGITQHTVDAEGIPFLQAFDEFVRFVKSDCPVWSHGGDGNILHENCKIYQLECPINQQQLTDIAPSLSRILQAPPGIGASDYPKFLGMNNAIKAAHRPHRALDDVRTLAHVLRKLRTDSLI